jgi:hypothetical protein
MKTFIAALALMSYLNAHAQTTTVATAVSSKITIGALIAFGLGVGTSAILCALNVEVEDVNQTESDLIYFLAVNEKTSLVENLLNEVREKNDVDEFSDLEIAKQVLKGIQQSRLLN